MKLKNNHEMLKGNIKRIRFMGSPLRLSGFAGQAGFSVQGYHALLLNQSVGICADLCPTIT
jgi:hypothetical protein